MAVLPKLGTMIRCVGPDFVAGSVAYAAQGVIQLPRRTHNGQIIPNAYAQYQLQKVGEEWIYKLVQEQ